VFPAHFGPGVAVHSGEFVSRKLGSLRHVLAPLTLNEDDFVDWALANVKDRPGNYQRIVRINMGQGEIDGNAEELEMGPNRCAIA
jgi:thiosulfate/3-mercaptopyruvate sulfurtransferase